MIGAVGWEKKEEHRRCSRLKYPSSVGVMGKGESGISGSVTGPSFGFDGTRAGDGVVLTEKGLMKGGTSDLKGEKDEKDESGESCSSVDDGPNIDIGVAARTLRIVASSCCSTPAGPDSSFV